MKLYADKHYTLTGVVEENGDLVLSGHDLSPWQQEMFGRDEYEYFYTVRAVDIARLCAALGVSPDDVLEGIKTLLAPHGISASREWRHWLTANRVPYVFAVR